MKEAKRLDFKLSEDFACLILQLELVMIVRIEDLDEVERESTENLGFDHCFQTDNFTHFVANIN